MEDRIVKVPLPVDLIRRMDEALTEGRGGLQTRAEFIREASEGLLAEITYEEAPPEVHRSVRTPANDAMPLDPSPPSAGEGVDAVAVPIEILAAVPLWEQEELRLSDLAGTALPSPGVGVTLESGVAQPDDEPLLGIHNRDYPSLWAALRLARYTQDELVSFDDFRLRATNAAWFYAQQLGSLEKDLVKTRLRALFPSNPQKRDSAERAFQTFAIGVIPRRPSEEGPVKAGGPLFAWRICQLTRQEGELMIGLTSSGRVLLENLAGISLALPHSQVAAERFLTHLVEQAPGESWGFEQIVTAVAGRPDREGLVSSISRARADWTPATASSVAQGYVARAREWGLLQPRLHQGRYSLTEFGRQCQKYLSGDVAGPIITNREVQK